MSDRRMSPFPGMDPFLERYWESMHGTLIVYARDALNEVLSPGLVAQAGQRLVVEHPEDRRQVVPDVHVVEDDVPPPFKFDGGATALAVAEPTVHAVLKDEPIKQRYVDILDVEHDRIITSIEFISPTNKRRGNGLDQYLAKQTECADSSVNLVEIDLTRAGRRELIFGDAESWLRVRRPDLRTESYPYAILTRQHCGFSSLSFYGIHLSDPLPTIGVPLRPQDDQVPLPLQSIVDQAYQRGRYGETVNYSRPLEPILDAETAAYIDQRLREAGVVAS